MYAQLYIVTTPFGDGQQLDDAAEICRVLNILLSDAADALTINMLDRQARVERLGRQD